VPAHALRRLLQGVLFEEEALTPPGHSQVDQADEELAGDELPF
jgi:hypothetical protein